MENKARSPTVPGPMAGSLAVLAGPSRFLPWVPPGTVWAPLGPPGSGWERLGPAGIGWDWLGPWYRLGLLGHGWDRQGPSRGPWDFVGPGFYFHSVCDFGGVILAPCMDCCGC